jgi:beta-1,2-mannobiose phosphorylase / 1,2-beta-oligomannan phosphorylase
MTKWARPLAAGLIALALFAIFDKVRADAPNLGIQTAAGWHKYAENPVLGGKLGTCFDISVLENGHRFLMWFSWRPKQSIAFATSQDGIHWGTPVIVLGPNPKSGWEADVNRPVVIRRAGEYQMWYTGQARDHSWIGYVTSRDGIHWKRMSQTPVLSPDKPWEGPAAMCPDVIWDKSARTYRMWYSAGGQYEPSEIGYATSPDGIHWTKWPGNPIFRPDRADKWEQQRVAACQVIHMGSWYYMFFIGFRDINHAQIGLARSRDGIHDWQLLPQNPIIRAGGTHEWDHDACYKPYAVWEAKQKRWLLWYNGRSVHVEQIGLAFHPGKSFGFPG